MKKLLILTEAGDDIGFGHYMRCRAIQQEAETQGIDTEMILFENGSNKLEINGQKGNWTTNEDIIRQYDENSMVLVDSYLASEKYYSFLKEWFKHIAVIDDYNRITYTADIIVNPNPYFDKIDYSNQRAKTTGGKDFIVFREAFRRKNPVSRINEELKNLLITIGGTDFRKILPSIIKAAIQAQLRSVTVVAPDFFELSISDSGVKILGRQNAEQMLSLYDEADVVISGCGQTLHELALLGKPTIGICLDADQKINQEYYFEKCFLSNRINWDDIDLDEKITDSINSLFSFYTRQLIKNFGPSLVNIDGVKNVVAAIQNMQAVTYRRALPGDVKLYFDWVNDKEVRRNSFNTDFISWKDHQQWFFRKIQSGSLMLVFFWKEEPFGQLRIDWEKEHGWVDYSIDNRFRGRGLGKTILTEAVDLLKRTSPGKKISGKVKNENKASKQSFEKSGFLLDSIKEENGNSFCIYSYNN